ncbi:MAG: ABC transporter substrate-binding protein [Candidatus Sumerlaeia bacterium]|nr:ABC transporter substrate-binding protein [Candidatus Sumerlaeia bacterium]
MRTFPRALPSLLAAAVLAAGCRENPEAPARGAAEPSAPTLRVMHDNVGAALEVMRGLAAGFESETGAKVEFVITPNDGNERLTQYLNFLGAKSPDVDVYMCDVVWTGMLGPHFADLEALRPALETETFPSVMANNTYDGKLVMAPYYVDAPVLYYRSDLLEKYGFEAPPKTWDELESMARAIMEGERAAGSASFWGYVWQGRSYEGLTCNMLEWQVSNGGAPVLDGAGAVRVDEPALAEMLLRARGWVGTISPPGVLSYGEEESRGVWQSGNAAFMRNWPYAYAPGQAEGSPVRGKFAVAPLPGGERSAGTLGGQMLAVSRHSRHTELAIQFVALAASLDAQKERALRGNYLATARSLYDDPEIAAAIPFFPEMRAIFENAVPRPTTAAGRYYNELSSIYASAGHAVLTGGAEPAEELPRAQADIEALLKR